MTPPTRILGPARSRRAEAPLAGLAQRVLAWATGAPRRDDAEKRSPLAKPFPFFGE